MTGIVISMIILLFIFIIIICNNWKEGKEKKMLIDVGSVSIFEIK